MALCSNHRMPSLISKPMFCCSSLPFPAPLSATPSVRPPLVLWGCGRVPDAPWGSCTNPSSNRMPPDRGSETWEAALLMSVGELPLLESESCPKDGTISLMTDVMGLSVARLVVRSPAPGLWVRELKDQDWLREWLLGFWRLEGKALGGRPP